MAARTPQSATPAANRKHRRIAYRVRMRRTFLHERDTDLIEGVYLDPEGDPLGQLILAEPEGRLPESFLVIPHEDIPLVHVEAALEADHRVDGFEQVFALLFEADEPITLSVDEMGERWTNGSLVARVFETDEDALDAQE